MAKNNAFKPKVSKEVLVAGAPTTETTPIAEEVVAKTTENDTPIEDTQEEETIDGADSDDTTVEEDTAQEEESKSNGTNTVETKTPEVVFVEPEKGKTVPDQNVKVRTGRNYSCFIGGVRYQFEKDKIQIVPKNVRNVLSEEENLLKPL